MKFKCQPVDMDFIDRAPWRFENIAELDATPHKVFDIFADGESWPKWFGGIRKVVWTSPEPKGVGTTRTVTLDTAKVDEYFLVWERGVRFAFRFEGANRPLFKAGVEDYRLEALPNGRTRFFYGVYIEPSGLIGALGLIAQPIFRRMFRKGTQGLVEYVKRTK